MIWFVTYRVVEGPNSGEEVCKRFYTIEDLWEWIDKNSDKGQFPKSLSVYKAECLFDGS